jgi:hypothetical protein
MNRKNRHSVLIQITSWLLCALFIVQIANRALYFHSHKEADGTIVCHAHPYNKSSDSAPLKKHHHSKFQFALLAHLNQLFFMAILLIALYDIFKKLVYVKRGILHYVSGFNLQKSGRSPPVFS